MKLSCSFELPVQLERKKPSMVSLSAYAVFNSEDTIKPKETSVSQSSLLMKQYCSWFIKDQKRSKLEKGYTNKAGFWKIVTEEF